MVFFVLANLDQIILDLDIVALELSSRIVVSISIESVSAKVRILVKCWSTLRFLHGKLGAKVLNLNVSFIRKIASNFFVRLALCPVDNVILVEELALLLFAVINSYDVAVRVINIFAHPDSHLQSLNIELLTEL